MAVKKTVAKPTKEERRAKRREEIKAKHEHLRKRRQALKVIEHDKAEDPNVAALIAVRTEAETAFKVVNKTYRDGRKTLKEARTAVRKALSMFLPEDMQ